MSLRGAGYIRLRVGFVSLTREPDTASTVGGKDAYMGYPLESHCTQTDCNAFFILGKFLRWIPFDGANPFLSLPHGGIPMQTKTKRLTESAMLISLAIVLELVSKMVIPEMPFGGQVTLVSMLPIVLISYRHGVRWGLVTGFGYALMEMALGARTVAAAFQPGYFGDSAMIGNAIVMCALDYLLAYTVLGIGGLFRENFVKPGTGLCLGTVVALSARYLCHIGSGYILFSGWAEWFFTQEGFPAWGAELVASLSPDMLGFVYSLVYNGMYMVPEIILTATAAVLVAKLPGIVTKIS